MFWLLLAVVWGVSAKRLPLNELNDLMGHHKFHSFQTQKKSLEQSPNVQKGWQSFESVVKASLSCPENPRAGISVSIFNSDRILYANSFGYEDIKKSTPLTTNSLMAIGSLTKSFTSTILASLASQGKFDFHEDVRTYLPELQFPPATGYASQRVTSVDLLAHRLGLGEAGSSMWMTDSQGLEGTAMGLQYLSPKTTFRTQIDYCNVGVVTAGYAGMVAANATWEELTKQLFRDLGMCNTYATWKEALHSGQYGKGYGVLNGELKEYTPEAQRCVDNVPPAGSIFSTIEDMVKYIRFHMNGGLNSKGEQIIPTQFLQETLIERELFRTLSFQYGFAPFSFSLTTSGMGWVNGHLNGRNIVWHNGGLQGATSFAVYMPIEDLGMVYLSNTESAISDDFSVMIAGLEVALQGYTSITPDTVCTFPCPWVPECFVSDQGSNVNVPEQVFNTTNGYASLKDYVGEYNHPAFGTLKVSLSGHHHGGLHITFGTMQCETSSQDRDIFVGSCETVLYLEPVGGVYSFGRSLDNVVDRVVVPLFDPEPITFTTSAYWPQSWPYPRLVPEED